MKKILFLSAAFFALAAPSPSMAGTCCKPITNNYTTNNNFTDNTNKSINNTANGGAGGNATATGGKSNATGGNAVSNSTSNGGNANASTGNQVVNLERTRRPANAPALGGLPSGPCSGVSAGFSLGVPAFGAGVQGGSLDGQCTLRENIRTLVLLGELEVAREMLNDLEGVKEARNRLNGIPPVSVAPPNRTDIASHTR